MAGHATFLDEHEWRERAARHRARVEPWIAPRRERRKAGKNHPVDDFLFDYYPYSVAKLSAWHPGSGVVLGGNTEAFPSPAYIRTDQGVTVDPARLAANLPRLRMVLRLLDETARRPAQFGCLGLHEWAMVHGLEAEAVRHTSSPLRISQGQVQAVIEDLGLRCTHIDAYRFFTPTAIPLNEHVPTRVDQHQWEQPGCLHANMDLYKYAMWFSPYVPSELIADAFELARGARELDMRASPYDLLALGFEPIAIETASGRRQYVDAQRNVANAAAAVRARLFRVLENLDEEVATEAVELPARQ